MNTIISILAFCGNIGALVMMLYALILIIKMRKMQSKNRILSSYIKTKSFLRMKNDGNNPCDTQQKFYIPVFSQESDYIVRRR